MEGHDTKDNSISETKKIGATFIPMTVIMSALDDMNMKDVR